MYALTFRLTKIVRWRASIPVSYTHLDVYKRQSVDSIWVKLAHTQDEQGWIREKELKKSFAPTDSISQAIHLFSDTHASYFVVIFALFVGAYLFRAFRRKQLQMVYFNDIDSVYPLFLCLLMAFSATIYESMQVLSLIHILRGVKTNLSWYVFTHLVLLEISLVRSVVTVASSCIKRWK